MDKKLHLDKVTKEFVKSLEIKDTKPLYELTPDEARKFLLSLQSKTHIEIDADIIDTFIPTENLREADVRFIRPKNSQNEILPLILYIHGGGWILGDKDTHDMLVRRLANCTNSVVAFVNYSHSPEAKYPTALNEIYAVFEYLHKHYKDFNINPDKTIIAGDSAGGNMAAAIAIKAKKENGPNLLLQVLLYPVTDASMDTESYNIFKNGPWLTKKAMEWFWDAYLPDKKSKDDIYVSPLKAEISDLENLPPALVIVDENDVLRDEGEAYASKLEEAGVDVFSVRINSTHHDFMMLNALAESCPYKGAFSIICNTINRKLNEV